MGHIFGLCWHGLAWGWRLLPWRFRNLQVVQKVSTDYGNFVSLSAKPQSRAPWYLFRVHPVSHCVPRNSTAIIGTRIEALGYDVFQHGEVEWHDMRKTVLLVLGDTSRIFCVCTLDLIVGGLLFHHYFRTQNVREKGLFASSCG